MIVRIGREDADTAFFVADNTNLNHKIARLLSNTTTWQKCYFFGCAAHRFDLAQEAFCSQGNLPALLQRVKDVVRMMLQASTETCFAHAPQPHQYRRALEFRLRVLAALPVPRLRA